MTADSLTKVEVGIRDDIVSDSLKIRKNRCVMARYSGVEVQLMLWMERNGGVKFSWHANYQ